MSIHLVAIFTIGMATSSAAEPTLVVPTGETLVTDFERPSGTDPSTLTCDLSTEADVRFDGEVGVISISPTPVNDIRADGTVHKLAASLHDGVLKVGGVPDSGMLLLDIPGIRLKQVPFMFIAGEGWYCGTLTVPELMERRGLTP